MPRNLSLAAFAALLLPLAALGNPAENRKKLQQVLLDVQVKVYGPVLEHCKTASPDTSKALASGYANYRTAMDAAIAKLVAGYSDSEVSGRITEEEEPEFNKQADEITQRIVAQIRQFEPDKYCGWLAERFQSLTPETAWAMLQKRSSGANAPSR